MLKGSIVSRHGDGCWDALAISLVLAKNANLQSIGDVLRLGSGMH